MAGKSKGPDATQKSADAEARARIDTHGLIDRLTRFVLGEADMTAPQVSAALGLLRKSLPDLSATAQSPAHRRDMSDLSDAELAAIAAAGGNRTAAKATGPD